MSKSKKNLSEPGTTPISVKVVGIPQKKNRKPEPARLRSSQGRKLNTRLFFRRLANFFWLDLLICLIVAMALVSYAEDQIAARADQIAENGDSSMPDNGGAVSVTPGKGTEGGYKVIKPFAYLLPDTTANSMRGFGTNAENSFWKRLDTLHYQVYYRHDGNVYRLSTDLGTVVHYSRYGFAVLLIFELLMLLRGAAKDRRIVGKTLNPIAELAAATESLNRAGSSFDPEKMAAIAGKLAGIDAAKLDTRIQVDETQAELKNLANAINGMLDRIDASYRAQVRFVSDASHELRTPISVIQGYANLLDRWGKNDEKTLQESITAIKDEAANMKDLVEQLLFLARGDNDTIQLQLETIALDELAIEVVHETEMIDASHTFQINAEAVRISGDRGLLKQSLRILVDNAIKYTDRGGHIMVAVTKEPGFAGISVSDDGIGIAPEIVPQIFDRFYRADESRTRATGGAGLGLSIAKWIATRHGGHMEVLSREGIGTKIMIALPYAEAGEEVSKN